MTINQFKTWFIDPLPVAGKESIIKVTKRELSEILNNYSKFYSMFKPDLSGAMELETITLSTHKFTRLILKVV